MAARFSLRLRHIGLSRNPEAPMRRVDGRRAGPTPLSESGRVEFSLIEAHLDQNSPGGNHCRLRGTGPLGQEPHAIAPAMRPTRSRMVCRRPASHDQIERMGFDSALPLFIG
jgi:hypothetical protein